MRNHAAVSSKSCFVTMWAVVRDVTPFGTGVDANVLKEIDRNRIENRCQFYHLWITHSCAEIDIWINCLIHSLRYVMQSYTMRSDPQSLIYRFELHQSSPSRQLRACELKNDKNQFLSTVKGIWAVYDIYRGAPISMMARPGSKTAPPFAPEKYWSHDQRFLSKKNTSGAGFLEPLKVHEPNSWSITHRGLERENAWKSIGNIKADII